LISTLSTETPYPNELKTTKEIELFKQLNTFFLIKWPIVIALFTPQSNVSSELENMFDKLLAVRSVKSQHILRNGIMVHRCLTEILLTGKEAQTSKGKHMKST
jgi:hypothetical protein